MSDLTGWQSNPRYTALLPMSLTNIKLFFQEIQRQADEHKESMERIMTSQSGDLDGLQKQFDEALKKAVEASREEIQVGLIVAPLQAFLLATSYSVLFGCRTRELGLTITKFD